MLLLDVNVINCQKCFTRFFKLTVTVSEVGHSKHKPKNIPYIENKNSSGEQFRKDLSFQKFNLINLIK